MADDTRASGETRTGAHGWPLVPSAHFPGELTLACPRCGSTRVTLSAWPGYDGRMFSPGMQNTIRCAACGMFDATPATVAP